MAEKALVAVSGGIDSAFACLLLQEAGYLLECVFLHLCDQSRCCTPEGEGRARRWADQWGIPFHSLEAHQRFLRLVIEQTIDAYRKGYTPNPCTLCNQWIKFGFLLDYARQKGFRYLATGHYARIATDSYGIHHLLAAMDHSKDQSYMLYRLPQEALGNVLFPLGDWQKQEVILRMQSVSLSWQEVPESQDLCFLPSGMTMARFLAEAGLSNDPGPIVDQAGRFLGQHRGLLHYTLGQRKRIGLPGGPFFVLEMLPKQNTLVIGRRAEATRNWLVAEDVSWIAPHFPPQTFSCQAKIRYQQPQVPVQVRLLEKNRIHVCFFSPQFAVTPGQDLVLYQEQEVVGGGVIASLGPLDEPDQ
jgi:tRNA-specific 2-thiouridylase